MQSSFTNDRVWPTKDVSEITKKFTFYFEGETTLTLDEIWPDGDAPDNPTSADVLNVVRDFNLNTLLNEWDLVDCISLYVEGKQVW